MQEKIKTSNYTDEELKSQSDSDSDSDNDIDIDIEESFENIDQIVIIINKFNTIKPNSIC